MVLPKMVSPVVWMKVRVFARYGGPREDHNLHPQLFLQRRSMEPLLPSCLSRRECRTSLEQTLGTVVLSGMEDVP